MRTMTQTVLHLQEAAKLTAQMVIQVREAKRHDPDPEVADDLYDTLLNNLTLTALYLTKRELQGSEKECAFCGQVFEPMGHNGNLRIRCYDPECEKARKRRNARLSARRVKARKRAQQA